jgi:hypothetical protein
VVETSAGTHPGNIGRLCGAQAYVIFPFRIMHYDALCMCDCACGHVESCTYNIYILLLCIIFTYYYYYVLCLHVIIIIMYYYVLFLHIIYIYHIYIYILCVRTCFLTAHTST